MKKQILLATFLSIACIAKSQVIFFVQEPGPLVGSYGMEWAPPSGGWGTPDLMIPANAITDTLAFVDDGTAADSLGCDPLVNATEITGKIAVVYRGDCEFGVKALNAQNAGAVGVVIINNVAGAPVGMGAGAQGANVTVPVVMISQADGALLRADIIDGKVVAFIGNIAGQFANNLAIYRADVRMAKASANPKLISENASELEVAPAAWVHNYGYDDQTDVTLNARVVYNTTTIYDETSVPVSIVAGDSAFIVLPTFSQPTYDGFYRMTYQAASPATDDFPDDNTFNANFLVDSLLSYANMDPDSYLPVSSAHYRSSTSTSYFGNCIHFRDANASRMAALGLYASATHSTGTTLEGDFLEITAYEWLDSFTGLSDPNAAVNSLNEVGYGEYFYDSDLNGVTLFIPFNAPVMLVDDQRYLFCVTTYTSTVFTGYDTYFDYDENITYNDQPVSVVNSDGTWYVLGFGTDVTSAVTAKMALFDVGVNESAAVEEIVPYPNPATNLVQIPLKGTSGTGLLQIHDMTGQLVAERRVALTDREILTLDLSGMGNGAYSFNLSLDNGKRSNFRVVISR